MRIVLFCHTLLSDWNHGNAHFLRGIVTELESRGHVVDVYEPKDSWSYLSQEKEARYDGLAGLRQRYPNLRSNRYELASLDLPRVLGGADLVIAHEWNDHELIAKLGETRSANPGWKLLFHDTHHRSVTDPEAMSRYDLRHYDGALVFGETIREIYLRKGWAQKAWTWHEAADTRVFKPLAVSEKEGDLVWIGNWGDEERSAELREFLLNPVAALKLRAKIYGVRYPEEALAALRAAQIEYGGWLPNYEAPDVFARYSVTVHVPRRPYAEALRGIPTIRVFEVLACGMPLVSAPWDDSEHLFEPGKDFLTARNGQEMQTHLQSLLNEPEEARRIGEHGRNTVLKRHTCSHRVDELMGICESIGVQTHSVVEQKG